MGGKKPTFSLVHIRIDNYPYFLKNPMLSSKDFLSAWKRENTPKVEIRSTLDQSGGC